MFHQIKNLIPNFGPPNFPTSILSGCFFHLCQNIYLVVIHFGLKTLYDDNGDFAKQIRSLPALTLLPIPDVIPTFVEIKAQFQAESEHVLTYFEEYYIGGIQSHLSHPRKAAKYDILLWNEQSYIDAEIIQANAGVTKLRRKDQVRQETRILNILNEPTKTALEKVMALAQIISLKKS
ncbi:unnamed protein product [Rotaria sordida]|uniref:Uncharacterized protein n=1 Tax=Rotaria sordida TaxID=392033 RepID=A0A814W6W3_9BILA|nr:unnamed protein product [Rotaria sordida]CAF3611823.1 unnamed protein product [Rotaria sordida]